MTEDKVHLLESKIGYIFKNKQYATDAITHTTYFNEHKQSSANNERLEFLGDSVLSLMVAEHLYKNVSSDEGILTKIRATVVCEESLFEFGTQIGIGECLLLGKGELAGKTRPSTVSDAVEAMLGAVYLDGGFEKAKEIIMPFLIEKIHSIGKITDYKTALQEIIQKNKDEILSYEIYDEQGPAHDRTFKCRVYINSNVIAESEGHSKKRAEQAAAKQALILMGVEV